MENVRNEPQEIAAFCTREAVLAWKKAKAVEARSVVWKVVVTITGDDALLLEHVIDVAPALPPSSRAERDCQIAYLKR